MGVSVATTYLHLCEKSFQSQWAQRNLCKSIFFVHRCSYSARNWQPHFLAPREQVVCSCIPWEGLAIMHLPDTKVQNNRSWLFGEVMFQHPAVQLKPVQVSPVKRRNSFEPSTKEFSRYSRQWVLRCYKRWTEAHAICPRLLHDIWKTHNKCLRSGGDIILATFQSGNRPAKVQSVRVKAGSTEQAGQPKISWASPFYYSPLEQSYH